MTTARRGFTLVEVLAVLLILVVLGALIVPSMRLFERDTKVLAGGDILRGLIGSARAEAMEHGLPYRLALSEEGTKARIAPDDQNFDAAQTTADDTQPRVAEVDLPKDVTATVGATDGVPAAVDADGWVRAATFLPDGTCREDAVTVTIRQPGIYPVLVKVRGLTGAATVQAQKSGAE